MPRLGKKDTARKTRAPHPEKCVRVDADPNFSICAGHALTMIGITTGPPCQNDLHHLLLRDQ